MGPTLNFRTAFAKVLTGSAVVITAVTLGYTAIEDGVQALWQAAPFVVFGLVLIWALFGHPRVQVSDRGVTVINIIRSVHIPWPTLQEVQTRWSLTLETDSGRHTSWAIPASSGMGTRLRQPRPNTDGMQSDAAKNLSGGNADAVAAVIGDRLRALQEGGHLDSQTSDAGSTSISWNARELILLAAGAALLVGTALIG